MSAQKQFFRCFLPLLAIGTFFCVPAAHAATESISRFDDRMIIGKDGTLLIKETIVYDFSSNERHGIYRDIPLTSGDWPRLDIGVLSVTDLAGMEYAYTTSASSDTLRIQIGDPDVLVSGQRIYIIEYEVRNAIRSFDDHDELYWNVTGDAWVVGIGAASALVTLPDPSVDDVKMACFTGPRGSTDKECSFENDMEGIRYGTLSSLASNEGLTIVLGMPRGSVENAVVLPEGGRSSDAAPGSVEQKAGSTLISVAPFFVPFIIVGFIVLLVVFVKKRVKPRPIVPWALRKRPIVVEYGPPDDLSPIEVGALLDRKVDPTDVSAVIIDLAVRGYLKINYTVKEISFWPDKKDFEFVKIKDGKDLEGIAYRTMFDLFFDGRESVRLSDLEDLRTTFYATMQVIEKGTEEHLTSTGYFDKKGRDLAKRIGKWSVGAFFAAYLVSMLFSRWAMAFFIVVAVIGSAFAIRELNTRLTPKGIEAFMKTLGFREFLYLTEKDKFALLDAPDLRPETFERFLPYAMVLGVEEEWAKKFEGIYNTVPAWYSDPTSSVFTSTMLVGNLSNFSTSFNHVCAITSPRSSSGFSGSGFSGGGGGGGGGGSW